MREAIPTLFQLRESCFAQCRIFLRQSLLPGRQPSDVSTPNDVASLNFQL